MTETEMEAETRDELRRMREITGGWNSEMMVATTRRKRGWGATDGRKRCSKLTGT